MTDPLTDVRENDAEHDRGSGARKPASVRAAEATDASGVTEVPRAPETETEIKTPSGGTLARPPAAEVVSITTSTGARDLGDRRAAGGSRPRGETLSRERGRRAQDGDRESLQGDRRPALFAPRPPTPPDQPPPLAGRPLGEDRRASGTAKPRRDREHLHPRPRRRNGTRLRPNAGRGLTGGESQR